MRHKNNITLHNWMSLTSVAYPVLLILASRDLWLLMYLLSSWVKFLLMLACHVPSFFVQLLNEPAYYGIVVWLLSLSTSFDKPCFWYKFCPSFHIISISTWPLDVNTFILFCPTAIVEIHIDLLMAIVLIEHLCILLLLR